MITRRRFVWLAGSALIVANAPIASNLARAAATPALKFGGLTPNAKFYVTSYGGTPIVNVSSWRLRIKGLVENPLELSYDDIRKMPPLRETLTLECISNPPDGTAIGNAQWVGARLQPILERARIKPAATHVAMHAADGYFTGLPREEITREENFLPYLMNGDPLPAEHGYPLRIFIPGKYGMKQPKWITEIEFVDREFRGYWEQRGWSNSAWRKVNSGFFTPRTEGGVLSIFGATAEVSSPVDIMGWALAGPSGIKRVEISTDDGETWRDAAIAENQSRYVWTVWRYRFAPAQPGKYLVRVRATDGNGAAQPREDHGAGEGLDAQARMTLKVRV